MTRKEGATLKADIIENKMNRKFNNFKKVAHENRKKYFSYQ